jgi:hypothetical protein
VPTPNLKKEVSSRVSCDDCHPWRNIEILPRAKSATLHESHAVKRILFFVYCGRTTLRQSLSVVATTKGERL